MKADPLSIKRLWTAVVLQLIEDVVSTGTTTEDIHNRKVAESWFRGNSEGYKSVCLMADIPSDKLRTRVMTSNKEELKEIIDEYRRTM